MTDLLKGRRARVVRADAVRALRALPDGCVDAVVTDPPYGLEFMGKDWDRLSGQPGYVERGRITVRPDAQVPYGRGGGVNSYQAGRPMQEWHEAWAREALRVLKPGGHLLAFGGTRTYHRLACAVEDAGFEIRDSLVWLYGSGFPKSLNVGKAIDAGKVGPVMEDGWFSALGRSHGHEGTALKPGYEPIVVARKPLVGTVARNVLEFGTGALNVDGCRIGTSKDVPASASPPQNGNGVSYGATSALTERGGMDPHTGRWPANVVLSHADGCQQTGTRKVRADGHHPAKRGAGGVSTIGHAGHDGLIERYADGEEVPAWSCVEGCPVAELDRQSGTLQSGKAAESGHRRYAVSSEGIYGGGRGLWQAPGSAGELYGDRGGASRFFYTAKASSAERNAGLDELPEHDRAGQSAWAGLCNVCGCRMMLNGKPTCGHDDFEWVTGKPTRNSHPTVKPLDVMRWLVRLVTPPGGLVLDLFAGTATTGCAAELEGFRFLGIEREAEYVPIARARLAWWSQWPVGLSTAECLRRDARRRGVLVEADARRAAVEAAGQPSLFD